MKKYLSSKLSKNIIFYQVYRQSGTILLYIDIHITL